MVKKALLIGINYLNNSKYRLSSPVNDIKIMKDFLVNYCNFQETDITLLSDSPTIPEAGSFFNIVKHIKKLNEKLTENDFAFIYFSGHGSKIIDSNNDENDKYDEVFLPQDFQINYLSDDLLHSLFKDLKSRAFVMFDCCNSGTICDFKYNYDIKNLVFQEDMKKTDDNLSEIFCLSASAENKNTYEKFIYKNSINTDKNKFYGELTIFFVHTLKAYLEQNLTFDNLSYENLINYLNEYLNDIKDTKKSVNYKLTHANILNKNLKPIVSLSVKNTINNTFLFTKNKDINVKINEKKKIDELTNLPETSLINKYRQLEKKFKHLIKINTKITKENDKLLSIVSGNINLNYARLVLN